MEEDREFIKEDKDAKKSKEKKKEDKQFPLRTYKSDHELTTHVKEFLIEYDFIVLMTLISIMTFITSQIFKIFAPNDINSNFLYYSLTILLIITIYYIIKQNTWPLEFSDENKILIMFGFKAFILSYMILGYFTEYFDFKIEEGIEELQGRTDQILKLAGMRYLYNPDSFYIAISVWASLLSITVVHLAIKFAYNFFFINKTHENPEEEDEEIAKKVNTYRILMTINFFIPLIAIFSFIPALSRSFVVPNLMTDIVFDITRMTVLIAILILKLSIFSFELQFNFNEGYFYVQSLLKNKSEKLFNYITLKMKLKFINTWITCFQYTAIIVIPLLFTLLYIHKYFEAMRNPNIVEYDFVDFKATLPKSEFVENVEPTASITDRNYLVAVVKQISSKGFIPSRLEAAILSYLLFSFYLSWFIVSTVGLVYYRKYKAV